MQNLSMPRHLMEELDELKPIEPLSKEETQDLVENWFADEWAQVKAIGLLRDYEAHILGENHEDRR